MSGYGGGYYPPPGDPYQPPQPPPPPGSYPGNWGPPPDQPPPGGPPPGAYGGWSPMPSEPSRTPTRPASAPSTVNNAAILMLVRAVVGVVGIVVAVANRDALKRALIKANTTLTPSQVNTAANVGLGVAVVIGLGITVLYVILAGKLRAGRSWARIVALVVAGLGVLGLTLVLARPEPALNRVIGVVDGLIDAAIITLLCLRPSTEYLS